MRLQGLVTICVVIWFGLGGMARAVTLTIKITNTTTGHPFQELLVVAHGAPSHLFNSGYPATAGLETLAECGDQGVLAAEVLAEDHRADVWGVGFYKAGVVSYPNLQQLGAGKSVILQGLEVTDAANTRLSIVGRMMLTNDGFVGLESVPMPTEPGSAKTFYLLAFDAGTEANNELLKISADPVCLLTDAHMAEQGGDLPGDDYLGGNGTGVDEDGLLVLNPSVTIHRGVLGDTYRDGGPSDLDFDYHRWTNPVATVTVTVQ